MQDSHHHQRCYQSYHNTSHRVSVTSHPNFNRSELTIFLSIASGSHQLFAQTFWSIENHFHWIAYCLSAIAHCVQHLWMSFYSFLFFGHNLSVNRNGIDSFAHWANIRLFWLINKYIAIVDLKKTRWKGKSSHCYRMQFTIHHYHW